MPTTATISQTVHLTAGDGHQFSAYQAGNHENGIALVLLQEIFGVNRHIRSVADAFAESGFYVIAPALFDRIQAGVELDADVSEDLALARGFATRLAVEKTLQDIAAAVSFARAKTGRYRVGVVGFCLGGIYAWLSSTRLEIDAAVGYYGSKIVRYRDEKPRCPVILHFGNRDHVISEVDVGEIEHAQPNVPVFRYDAGHAFNRDGGSNYSPEAASLAWTRSVKFLHETLTA
jgi:carboxymethylenebutenolidase